MPKSISRKKLVKKFKLLGFSGPFSGGRHQFMVRDDLKVRVPNDHGEDVSVGLVCEVLRQVHIDRTEWDSL